MNLPEFFEKYPDEASCIEGFKAKRLEMGIVCKKC
ncbi:TPA: IS1595 family transposase, partial [Flavobacterium psychrophilum]